MPRERPGNPEAEHTPIPGHLDLVRIDGRWAQVVIIGIDSMVQYLDDGSPATVVWDEYRLADRYATHVAIMERTTGLKLTKAERDRVHPTYDTRTRAQAVNDVKVYGAYEKKTEAVE